MSRPIPNPPPGFESLTAEEKIKYVQSLWDYIASEADAAPLPEWQRRMLDERLEDLEKNPDAEVPWPEVRGRILK
jgi:putative addiction module component (TIGR02574 family)